MDRSVVNRVYAWFFIPWMLMFATSSSVASPEFSREYTIKAAYLYNLTKFINWPPLESTHLSTESTNRTNTVICTYANNPFDKSELEKLKQKQSRGKPISVQHITDGAPIDGCAMVFIAGSEEKTALYLNKIANPGVLTVGENDQFLQQGGVVALVLKDNRIQLQIHLTRAKAAGFSISSNLLEIAKVVR